MTETAREIAQPLDIEPILVRNQGMIFGDPTSIIAQRRGDITALCGEVDRLRRIIAPFHVACDLLGVEHTGEALVGAVRETLRGYADAKDYQAALEGALAAYRDPDGGPDPDDPREPELDAAARTAAPGWRPIESAPKTGRVVFGLMEGVLRLWSGDCPYDDNNCGMGATHWMPLPAPPGAASPSPPAGAPPDAGPRTWRVGDRVRMDMGGERGVIVDIGPRYLIKFNRDGETHWNPPESLLEDAAPPDAGSEFARGLEAAAQIAGTFEPKEPGFAASPDYYTGGEAAGEKIAAAIRALIPKTEGP